MIGDAVDAFAPLPGPIARVQCLYVAARIAAGAAMLVTATDRTEAVLAELQRQATVDSLTGLVTRRVLDAAAHAVSASAAAAVGTGLIVLDVDAFKRINDRLGHPAGDTVLVELAGVLMAEVRTADTVSRPGGDEIAVLLPDCSLEATRRRAERILLAVRRHVFSDGSAGMVRLSVSIGLAHSPTHGGDLRGLYNAADRSLYAGKRAGRDRIGPVGDLHMRPAAERPGGPGHAGQPAVATAG